MRFLFLAGCLAVLALPASAQSLTIRVPAGRELRLSAADFAAMPDTAFEALDHARPTRFRGVPLRAVLARAGVAVDSLRGPSLRRVLVLRGADGYAAVIALADLDASLGGTPAYVVTQEQGAPLSAAQGPYRAIIIGDARAARWVRQLVELEIVDVP